MKERKGKGTNRLAGSGSPYLLQHAGNPVDWHPWSDEAFETARTEDKPVFLSIGYSTCHWCHVMERESFNDPEVAALLNDTFVCVKVDREERPDIDHLYMTVCQLLTGSGGWPLSIVMTPEKEPFFAGTYFPRDDRHGRPGMLQIVPRIGEIWRTERENVSRSAAEITQALHTFMEPDRAVSPAPDLPERAYDALRQQYDTRHGGFGPAPKFPMFSNLFFLLRHWHRTGRQDALAMACGTLDAMRMGGIYDQIGSGLHRYSTDERWFAPHFEKMLYDQALAVLAYTEAWAATGEPRYGQTAREIITYVLRDLTSPGGGFYSAEDADSEGEEGRFYTWTLPEIEKVLDAGEVALVREVYGVSEEGNFQEEPGRPTGRNILFMASGRDGQRAGPEAVPAGRAGSLAAVREKLLAARSERVRPLRDEKIMTDWNGLMIAALARAAGAFGDASYAEAAGRALDHVAGGGSGREPRLAHLRYGPGKQIEAFLDDYAYLLWGIVELHQFYLTAGLLELSLELARQMVELFGDTDAGGFFLTRHGGATPVARLKTAFDGPMPSGNGVAIMNLLRLGRLTAAKDLEEAAQEALAAFAVEMASNPAGHAYMVSALELALGGTAEVVIVGDRDGKDTERFREALQRVFLPAVTAAVVDPGAADPRERDLIPYASGMNKVNAITAAHVCRDFACLAPTTDPEEMLRSLGKREPALP